MSLVVSVFISIQPLSPLPAMTCLCTGILFADVACWPVSHVPEEGELVTTEKIELNLGGCASNVAFGLARLGVPVSLAGCVGDDALSDFIVRAVSVPGIDARRLQRSPGRCPGTAMHLNVRGQDRRFVCTTGANDDFVFNDELRSDIAAPSTSQRKILYLGGYFMLRGLENEGTVDFLKSARQNGWTVLVDVVLNGRRAYWELIEPILPYIDILLPNEHEGEKITDYRDPYDQAKVFRDAGVGTVVITQGELGALCFSEKECLRVGVYPSDYLSGSGAGDAFTSGLIAGFLEGCDLQDALRWACAQGAACVRGVSTTGNLFDQEELLDFIARNTLLIEGV